MPTAASQEQRHCARSELTTLDSWLRSGIAAGPNVSGVGRCFVALGRRIGLLRSWWWRGSVVRMRKGRVVGAGSRLWCRVRSVVCLVESPDDERVPAGRETRRGARTLEAVCLARCLGRKREPWLRLLLLEDRLARAEPATLKHEIRTARTRKSVCHCDIIQALTAACVAVTTWTTRVLLVMLVCKPPVTLDMITLPSHEPYTKHQSLYSPSAANVHVCNRI